MVNDKEYNKFELISISGGGQHYWSEQAAVAVFEATEANKKEAEDVTEDSSAKH